MTGGGESIARKNMSVMSHIRELQIRLTISAVVLIIAATLTYVFRDAIISLLLSPLNGQQLIYLNPGGGFSFILLISVYVGLAVAAPVAIHQTYIFIRPILSPRVQKSSLGILACSLALLIAGVVFGYIFAIPGALNFLYTFAEDYIKASLTADSYLNFIVAYTLGIGLVFQLPLILMIIHWIKPLTPTGLFKSQRWVILLSFVAAAIITPTPDPINQTIIAIPIILVYQLGVIAVLVSIHREKKRTRLATKTQTLPEPEVHAEATRQLATQEVNMATTTASTISAVKPAAPRQARMIDGFRATTNRTQPLVNKPEQQTTAISHNPIRSIDGVVRSAAKPLTVPDRPELARQINEPDQTSNQDILQTSNYRGSLSLDGVLRVTQ